jgi:hypothetical protein
MKKLLIILILFPVIAFSQDEEIIKFEKDNFSIEYPATWILNNTGEHGTEFFLHPKQSESSNVFTENINLIKSRPNASNITIEDYQVIAEKQVFGMMTQAKINKSEIIDRHGYKFYKLIAEGYSNNYKFKTAIYSWFKDNQIYTLSFVTLYETFENNHIESFKIMDSFKFI